MRGMQEHVSGLHVPRLQAVSWLLLLTADWGAHRAVADRQHAVVQAVAARADNAAPVELQVAGADGHTDGLVGHSLGQVHLAVCRHVLMPIDCHHVPAQLFRLGWQPSMPYALPCAPSEMRRVTGHPSTNAVCLHTAVVV